MMSIGRITACQGHWDKNRDHGKRFLRYMSESDMRSKRKK